MYTQEDLLKALSENHDGLGLVTKVCTDISAAISEPEDIKEFQSRAEELIDKRMYQAFNDVVELGTEFGVPAVLSEGSLLPLNMLSIDNLDSLQMDVEIEMNRRKEYHARTGIVLTYKQIMPKPRMGGESVVKMSVEELEEAWSAAVFTEAETRQELERRRAKPVEGKPKREKPINV